MNNTFKLLLLTLQLLKTFCSLMMFTNQTNLHYMGVYVFIEFVFQDMDSLISTIQWRPKERLER